MKMMATIFTALSFVSTVYAADVPAAASEKIKAQVMTQLMASPAVRGAYAESKKWASAKTCSSLQIEEVSESEFKVYASCDHFGESKEQATGQFHVRGQILSGMNKDSPVTIVIESIVFTNAG